MNAVAEPPRMPAMPSERSADHLAPQSSGATYALGLVIALGLHALILFGVRQADVYEQAEFAVQAAESSVEVSLVAALPAEEPAPLETPPPLEPEPVPPSPPE